MTLSDLKTAIENKQLNNNAMVFLYPDVDFLPLQYITAISVATNKSIKYIDSLTPKSKTLDIFGTMELSNELEVYIERDVFKVDDDELRYKENTIVVTKNIEANTKKLLYNIIIEFPKIEPWQIQDYVKSQLKTLSDEKITKFIELCGNNIYRIEQEIDKLRLFNPSQYDYVFDVFQKESVFADVTNYTIFNLTNAIQSRDLPTVSTILNDIDKMGIDTFGILSVLYQNFRKMIQIWLDPNPTEESTGIKNNQIWAIKNMKKNYSREQLLKCFEFLLTIDGRIKTGELNFSRQIDYIVEKILSF